MNKKKAKGLAEGLAMGGKSLGLGIAEGFAGLVTQPMKGVQQDGAKGFFMGIAKGLGGLVAKPVSGVLDTVSKTAEVFELG